MRLVSRRATFTGRSPAAGPEDAATAASSVMISISAAPTDFASTGILYIAHQPMAHRTPRTPAIRNTMCQPHRPMIAAITGVATAVPMRAPES